MILLVDKIEKSFGARVLFSGASFQINPGERFALVGPNGAGKTTMLKIIMGIDSPDAGQIQYAKDCQVGYLEQETNLEQKDTTILAEVMPPPRKSATWANAPTSYKPDHRALRTGEGRRRAPQRVRPGPGPL